MDTHEKRTMGQKYHLSTEGFYFIYRPDKYNPDATRAELFRTNGESVKAITVSGFTYVQAELSHTDVINHFEAEISLGRI